MYIEKFKKLKLSDIVNEIIISFKEKRIVYDSSTYGEYDFNINSLKSDISAIVCERFFNIKFDVQNIKFPLRYKIIYNQCDIGCDIDDFKEVFALFESVLDWIVSGEDYIHFMVESYYLFMRDLCVNGYGLSDSDIKKKSRVISNIIVCKVDYLPLCEENIESYQKLHEVLKSINL